MALGYGLLGSSATSSILGAVWTLVAVVAAGFRGVLDAMSAQRAGSEPSGEPGDRGGVRMPSWLSGSDARQK
jgi:hypothetical protein